MVKLNLNAVEARVAPLAGRDSYNRDFVFDLLLAYGKPQGNVTRLRNGSLNVAADPETEVAQKNVVFFKETSENLLAVNEELKTSPTVVRYRTRFVIVTDYDDIVATDTKTGETIGFPIREIDQHFTFFLPWAGMEKAQYTAEAHADVKAAERVGKLFDELVGANPDLLDAPNGRHALNIFFTRLLFCYFAEDTGIFEDNQFTNAVGSHTLEDGADVAEFLGDLFTALDTERAEDKPAHLRAFPYVNGRLFTVTSDHVVPEFTKKARQLLIEAGTLIWREINPDIFGSMFQAIVTPGKRSDLGQHYTSVPNILKTIEPLFLDELKDQLDASFDSEKKLEALLKRIAEIKIFDPACGSGNFLVIAYKELRRLEHAILERLAELRGSHQGQMLGSKINIENFFGIEIDDFAVEVAILSLWIAKHQMNVEFKEKFGEDIPLIPLKEMGQIRQGNATRIEWSSVCENDGSEIYLIGNPPYVGTRDQTKDQKADYSVVFGQTKYSKNLDYISLWFYKGAEFISESRAKLAFVTTSSIARGEHVGLLFPLLFNYGVEISFAYAPFKWENNARKNAGVTVSVVGLRAKSSAPKYLFENDVRIEVDGINGYLSEGDNVFISRRNAPLNHDLSPMYFGNMGLDHGYLFLTPEERNLAVQEDPRIDTFLKRVYGSKEYIQGLERYCLWIEDSSISEAKKIPEIARRIQGVRDFRSASSDAGTRQKADRPWSFREQRRAKHASIVVPKTSSELREYLPIGFLSREEIITDLAFAVFDAPTWLFALLTSRMHNVWIQAVAGRKDNRLRYSNTIVYNNFPVPPLSLDTKNRLEVAGLEVLDAREYHAESTLAELYKPGGMPDDLARAHREVDTVVDSLYSRTEYDSDDQRLADLFKLYIALSASTQTKRIASGRRGVTAK